MGENHDCFFCTMSIVRYFDRNVKKCSTSKNVVITVIADVSRLTTIRKLSIKNTYVSTDLVSLSLAFLFGGKMFQTKRFGLVASRQEYQMLCRAEGHMNKIQKKKPTGQRLPAFKVHKNK